MSIVVFVVLLLIGLDLFVQDVGTNAAYKRYKRELRKKGRLSIVERLKRDKRR